jgi:hypothetical protein
VAKLYKRVQPTRAHGVVVDQEGVFGGRGG